MHGMSSRVASGVSKEDSGRPTRVTTRHTRQTVFPVPLMCSRASPGDIELRIQPLCHGHARRIHAAAQPQFNRSVYCPMQTEQITASIAQSCTVVHCRALSRTVAHCRALSRTVVPCRALPRPVYGTPCIMPCAKSGGADTSCFEGELCKASQPAPRRTDRTQKNGRLGHAALTPGGEVDVLLPLLLGLRG
jgi:hypothetical protein